VGIEYGENPLTCPVLALKAWIHLRGRGAGKLFYHVRTNGRIEEQGLIGDRISERLKLALESIGEDPKAFGSHSLRAGMVTVGIERGVSETAIMMRTGHKSLDTMRGYVRSAQAFAITNPMAGVL
jgi:integrase